ncbi:MAG: ribonuclease H-like domain-containing protein [Ferrimicrobium sp.]
MTFNMNALKHIVVLDIETELISDEMFLRQKNRQDVFGTLPKPRVCVTYDARTREYRTFMPDEFRDLYQLACDRAILSFNGKHFDLPVILQHLELPQNSFDFKTDHLDLLDMIRQTTGASYKLDQLAILNLGQHKHTDGRKMRNMDIGTLTEACRSDVDQTYSLAQMFAKGELQYPRRRYEPRFDHDDDDYLEYIPITDIKQIEQIEWWFKKNERRAVLEEAAINGHKYSETDKRQALDGFLIEQIGRAYNELIDLNTPGTSNNESQSALQNLDFEGRCMLLSGLLLGLGIRLPMDMLDMTDGQQIDVMTKHDLW